MFMVFWPKIPKGEIVGAETDAGATASTDAGATASSIAFWCWHI